MRRPLLVVALIVIALLACCGVVLGFLVWQNQTALTKQVEDLKTQVDSGKTPAPAPSGTNPGSNPTTPPVAPPTGFSCVGEGKTIGIDAPNSECCPGLIQVDLTDSTSVSQGLSAKCIRL